MSQVDALSRARGRLLAARWEGGSFLSLGREAGCTGAEWWSTMGSPQAGNGEQWPHSPGTLIQGTAYPHPAVLAHLSLPASKKACSKTVPDFRDVPATHVKVQCFAHACMCGAVHVGLGGGGFRTSAVRPQGLLFQRGQVWNQTMQKQTTACNHVGRAVPPQPP